MKQCKGIRVVARPSGCESLKTVDLNMTGPLLFGCRFTKVLRCVPLSYRMAGVSSAIETLLIDHQAKIDLKLTELSVAQRIRGRVLNRPRLPFPPARQMSMFPGIRWRR